MAAKTYLKATLAISLFSVVFVFSGTAHAKIIYVDDDAAGASDGSSWANAFNYLQDALSAAWRGDEIWVAQGTHKPDEGTGITPGDREATFQLINGVTIKGGYAGYYEPDPNARDIELYETILSGDLASNDVGDLYDESRAENSYHVVTGSGIDATAVLDGFTITGGNANDGTGYCDGGGMYNNTGSPTLSNCTFIANSARYGGGMYNREGSNPTLNNCAFSSNESFGGGGMCNWIESSPTLTNCTFSRNFASYVGGGVLDYTNCNPTLRNCAFIGNSAGYGGGGMHGHSGNPTLTNCTFSGNSAHYYGGGINEFAGTLTNCTFTCNSAGDMGGGMRNAELPNVTLTNCTFSGNSAGDKGGGMSNKENSPTLTNCTFSGNSARCGGGMYNGYHSSPTITNCTFNGNWANGRGGGMYDWSSAPTVTNCILWDNFNSEIDGSAVVRYSDVQGGWPGEGNIDADPCFVQPGYWDADGVWVEGDYHLLPDSPCIDAGDPNYVPEPNETDLDGRPRVMAGRIDMGAYESPIPAEAKIVPRTINLTSKGTWITSYIWLPEEYNVADIIPHSVFLDSCLRSGVIPAKAGIQAQQLRIDEKQQIAIARFIREEVQAILSAGDIELIIIGRFTDGTQFEATDTIKVIDKAEKN